AGIGNDQAVINTHYPAKPTAGFTRAQGRVEGERAGYGRAVFNIALSTVQALAETPGGFRAIDTGRSIHRQLALSVAQGRFDRFHETFRLYRAGTEAVLNHIEKLLLRGGGFAAFALFRAAAGRDGLCFFVVQAGVALLMQQGFNFLLREVGWNLD